jgi:zinc protease
MLLMNRSSFGKYILKNYNTTMGLVQEILLQPRWDAKEFDLIKQSTLSQILQQKQIPIALLETNTRN